MIELHHRHAGDYEKVHAWQKPGGSNRGRVYKRWPDLVSGTRREYIKTAVPKSEAYGVNDIVIVKAEGFLEEHIVTGEAVE